MGYNKKHQNYNDKMIRQSQLISPWGIGAIVPFPDDETLMIAGLDKWNYNNNASDFLIDDKRLQKRLNVQELRLPPDFRTKNEDENNSKLKILAFRFPLWHFCPICGKMKKIAPTQKYQEKCSEHRNVKLVPERFIVVCESGHIDDFPIAEWLHQKHSHPYNPEDCKIKRYSSGKSAALSSVGYKCSCGASRSMAGAFNEKALSNIGITCNGTMPWLGSDTHEECGNELKVVQRGASNVWFPSIVSSIKIPSKGNKILEKHLDILEKAARKYIKNDKLNSELLKPLYDSFDELNNEVSFDEFIKGMENRVFEEDSNNTSSRNHNEIETEYRKTEYDIISDNFGDDFSELHSRVQSLTNYSKYIQSYVKKISAISKLSATRAFIGFSRLSPVGEKSYYDQRRKLSKNKKNWVPAVKNKGEGIFIELDSEKVNKWAEREDVKERIRKLDNRRKESVFMKDTEGSLRAQFVLIHTFSHLLINQLTYECGYSASSIRERIYCEESGEDGEMYGVLIYTASGDSEGTMGGLVEQAQPEFLNRIVEKAIDNARWCSTDPVCIESEGQGTDSLNLAACHNCALLPETSCEFSNRLLDRGVLIGTLNNTEMGFFN